MVNEIIDGISIALDSQFPNVKIYSESLLQGFHEPCFFIVDLPMTETPLLGNRAKRNMHFDIHYFPESKLTPKNECREVASQLYVLLREFSLLDGSIVRGLNMRYEIIDNVLHFFIDIKPIIYYKNEEVIPNMENLSFIEGVEQ